MSQYSTSDEALENISIETVMNRIQELPEIYKDPLMLYLGNDMDFKQIAKTLKISEATARKRVQLYGDIINLGMVLKRFMCLGYPKTPLDFIN